MVCPAHSPALNIEVMYVQGTQIEVHAKNTQTVKCSTPPELWSCLFSGFRAAALLHALEIFRSHQPAFERQ